MLIVGISIIPLHLGPSTGERMDAFANDSDAIRVWSGDSLAARVQANKPNSRQVGLCTWTFPAKSRWLSRNFLLWVDHPRTTTTGATQISKQGWTRLRSANWRHWLERSQNPRYDICSHRSTCAGCTNASENSNHGSTLSTMMRIRWWTRSRSFTRTLRCHKLRRILRRGRARSRPVRHIIFSLSLGT